MEVDELQARRLLDVLERINTALERNTRAVEALVVFLTGVSDDDR